ncbi:MAG: hypothetical protein JSS60_02795 [Verrucomicrobia bacterium]|nr:hypothetical protein [Verrucomicrobiota bacterium]
MLGFLYRFIHKTRTLKVNILSLFLSLFFVAFLIVISFLYSKDYKSIRLYSKEVADQSISIILAKFQSVASASEMVTEVSADFFSEMGPINIQNNAVVSYLLNVVKYDQNISNFYIGLPNGNFIGAIKEGLTLQKTFITDPSKLLPRGTEFALRFIDASKLPEMNTFVYLTSDFKETARENIITPHFDTLKRPWYDGAARTKHLFWTGFYTFKPSLATGISIGNPMYNANGDLTAVFGADLTFLQLSNFLYDQKVGKTGRAFILDDSGQIIAPKLPSVNPGKFQISPELISLAYNRYRATPERPDYILNSNGGKFICFVAKLPVIFGSDWYIVTAAPMDDYLGDVILLQEEAMAIIVVIMILSGWIVFYFAKRISSPIVVLADEVDKISKLDLDSKVRVSTNIKEISMIDGSIAAMRRVIRSFAKYVPKEIVRDLFEKKEDIVLGGESREVTIFFSDIAGFTSIAESNSIDVLIPLLSDYFDAMSKIILSSHGTIDKFLGDGIMAFWGAPISFPDHAARACSAALRCNAMLSELNAERRKAGLPEFTTRFGINTGTVIVGNIGTEDRMNYTVIGEAVNTTSLLQEVDKIYHTSIIISEDVFKMLGDEFVARPLDEVGVKGKRKKIKIYELVGKIGEDKDIQPYVEQIVFCRAFAEAYEAMQRKDYNQAERIFTELVSKFPEDYPTQIYLKRIKESRSKGVKGNE